MAPPDDEPNAIVVPDLPSGVRRPSRRAAFREFRKLQREIDAETPRG